jgi:hypothetical protein
MLLLAIIIITIIRPITIFITISIIDISIIAPISNFCL